MERLSFLGLFGFLRRNQINIRTLEKYWLTSDTKIPLNILLLRNFKDTKNIQKKTNNVFDEQLTTC